MRVTIGLFLGLSLLAPAAVRGQVSAGRELAEADQLRKSGELRVALALYETALAAGAPKGATLYGIARCREAMGEYRAAEAAYEQALADDPQSGEIRSDLEGLRRRRGLGLRADLGGTEPGTSRQAFEGVVRYGGLDHVELQAGYSYTDQVFYTSNRGFVTAYRFYGEGDSYVKGDATLRKYDYPTNGAPAPNPDSNAYEWVPRGEVELSHRFIPMVRTGLQYQLFPANFFHDTSSWTVNHKLSAEVEIQPVAQLRVGARAAALRDPDPNKTEILGRPPPGSAPGTPGASATNVVYRTTSLVGGWAAVDVDRVGVKLEYLPNRDLDNSYDWSLLTTLDLRLLGWLDVRLQEVHDAYASVSNFPGKTAEIVMGTAGIAVGESLRFRGGFRYVDAPTRTGGTVIVGLELRTGIL